MDESLDVSGFADSIHTVHSCQCGYYSTDKSNYNKHVKRCRWHTLGPRTSTPVKQNTIAQASTSASVGEVQPQTCMVPIPSKPLLMYETCGKNYKTKYGLNLHIKSKHSNNFKHRCSLCEKACNQSVQYRFHCTTHLKVSIDKCPHCKLSFSSNGSLSRHLKTCINNKESFERFKCDKCDATFPHGYRLRYNQRGKHEEKRYTCEGCSKTFAWRSSLKVHYKHCPSNVASILFLHGGNL
ncbi:hypothetical protein DPMN_124209 [Dreissena polymorpha]|uniref:C2H2-type domain-containing protein n=1 Tax=Dreissena polymorpha TaxID=45954 RepID=A0A9D4GVY9_DREPO|nr:hypothetical protein DPMN_124209 [Dreissena polymorpha]